MTTMKSYTKAYNDASDAIRGRWEAFKKDQIHHQDIDSIASDFLNLISREIDALYSDFKHDVVDKIVHPTRGQYRENRFLKKLCSDWRFASERYQKSPEPIVQFLNSVLDSHRRESRIELIGKDLESEFLPEALDWSESRLAGLLGQYLAKIKLMDELNEIRDSALAARWPSAVADGSTGPEGLSTPKRDQPEKMIGLKPAVIALHFILQKIYALEETPEMRPEMKDLAEFLSILPANARSIATTLSKTWRSDTSELADVSQTDFQKAGTLLRKIGITPDEAFLDREHPTR